MVTSPFQQITWVRTWWTGLPARPINLLLSGVVYKGRVLCAAVLVFLVWKFSNAGRTADRKVSKLQIALLTVIPLSLCRWVLRLLWTYYKHWAIFSHNFALWPHLCRFRGLPDLITGEMSMFSGLSKSLNMGGEAEAKPTFNLGATGEKFNQAASKLANGEIPTFQEESAFAKCCPNLTFRQVWCLLKLSGSQIHVWCTTNLLHKWRYLNSK